MKRLIAKSWRLMRTGRLILKMLAVLWVWSGGLPNPCLAGEGIFAVPTEALLIGSVLAVLALGALSYWMYTVFRPKIPVLLARAQKALARQNLSRARKNFSVVVDLLEAREQLSAEEQRWLQESHCGLAAIGEAQELEEVAIAHYVKAYHAGLPVPDLTPGGLTLLATALAATRNLSGRAIEVYLAYLELKPDPISARAVCTLLAQVGVFNESAPQDMKLRAVQIARAVVDVDDQQEWAQFSLGVASVVNGKPELAVPFLLQAGKLDSDRPTLWYWIGQACRLKDEPHLEGARTAFAKFLEVSQEKEDRDKRALAAFFLGASLVEDYGWSWSQVARVSGDQASPLREAADWLERALAEGKVDGETYYYLGRVHFLRGLNIEAASALTKAVESAPEQRSYVYALGMLYLALNDRQEAERSFLQALRLDAQHQETRRALARLYSEDGRWAEAEEQCKQLLSLAPPDAEMLSLLILALYRQGKYEAVVARAEDFRQYAPAADAASTVFLIAQAHSHTRDYQGTVDWHRQAQSLSPKPDGAYYLAKALGHLARYEEARQTLAPLLTGDYHCQLPAFRLDADLLFKLGRYEEAQAHYRIELEVHPGDAEILYCLGAAAYNLGDLTQAGDLFAQSLTADGRQGGALLGEGLVREARGDLQGAQERYRQVLDLDPQQPAAHERLAVFLCKDQQYGEAFEHLLNLGARATESEPALYYLGLTLFHLGELKRALDAWSLLLARRPADKRLEIITAQCRYLLGRHYAEQELYAEAIVAWQQYLQVFPEDGQTRAGLAEMLWRVALTNLNGSPEGYRQARAKVQQALDFDPQRWQFLYYDALLAMGSGDLEGARSRLEMLAEKSPEDSRLQYHLGLVALRQGAPDQARSFLEAAAQKGRGGEYAFRAILAMANERIGQGDYTQAADLLVQAMSRQAGPGTEEAVHG